MLKRLHKDLVSSGIDPLEARSFLGTPMIQKILAANGLLIVKDEEEKDPPPAD